MNHQLDHDSQHLALVEHQEDQKQKRSNLLPMAIVLTSALAVSPAFAAADDFAPIVTLITGLVATVASIGLAVLTVFVTAKTFKWVKAAF